MTKRQKDAVGATGAVLATIASLWIIIAGLSMGIVFFIFAGFFFLLATCASIMIYLLRGTTWPK